MPSSGELAANIWLINDYVDTWAHKNINQTLPLQTNRVLIWQLWGKIVNYVWRMEMTWLEGKKFPCLLSTFVFLKMKFHKFKHVLIPAGNLIFYEYKKTPNIFVLIKLQNWFSKFSSACFHSLVFWQGSNTSVHPHRITSNPEMAAQTYC